MSDKQKISEYIDNLTFRKSLCMGFHPDEVYEAICNLTSMYNAVLSEAYDEADRLRDENDFLRRNADRLNAQTQPPAVTGEEENNRNTEMVDEMNSNLWRSTGENNNTGFDTGLAELLSVIKQPENKEDTPIFDNNPPFTAVADDVSPEPASALSADDSSSDDTGINGEPAPVSDAPEACAPAAEKKPAAPRSALNDKQIQRLKRGELLEILIESSRENEMLRGQVDSLNDEIAGLNGKLSDRKIKIEKAGNLAEAALSLNGVFEAAQAAARQYLDNLQDLYDREEENCIKKEKQVEALVERLLADTNKKCSDMTRAAEEECAAISSRTLERCSSMEKISQDRCLQMEAETKQKCDALVAEAERQAQQHWDSLTKKLEAFYDAHKGLRELLTTTGYISRG